ncbi:DUF1800 domain-containing protein [Puniceicoccales bacterium CK1056]|uniref:DUF1800 domain-containing protein n=1 Tax=Oceanipulchritudo coccoides TaxID=2706888 RepID=A0A6B2LZY2_9BACT|nr:DUF1800 family protein [Oceanipulchritudo coccoides]NDV62013.1 DUF1800 domain-containing protein [Oceanipulchritudo coccoides]
MSPTPQNRARILAISVSSLLVPLSGQGMESLELTVTDGQMHIQLPPAGSPDMFQSMEWSRNLIDWQMVGRDYGFGWENSFPNLLSIAGEGTNKSLTHPLEAGARFFRGFASPSSGLNTASSVSRFLQQASFGPTRDLIDSFPGIETPSGINDYPYGYFEQWIDEQMALDVTSLRKFWRERSNPAFVDNSLNSPFEVGHNPANGTQLSYWLNGQDRIDPDQADAIAAGRNANDVSFSAGETKEIVWYQVATTAPDALRQRAAWALSQIFVLGEGGSTQTNAAERFLVYYDIFVRHAFGNFRDILGEVTFNPSMGDYLTYLDNRKEDPVVGTFPDENYAREIMQLFTIGIWMLNQDGSLQRDANGNGIPTYDNNDIIEVAKIFTGLRKQYNGRSGIGDEGNIEIKFGNYVDPMRMQSSWHDFSAKTLLDGSTLDPFPETNAGAIAEINAFLDHLFNHPNVGPFIARRLIQRLTVSNPSPNYIQAVAQAFNEGTYNGSGTGQRGDLAVVFKAILLHPEAREPALSLDTAHGKLREPLVRLLHYARVFEITSPQTFGLLPFWKLDQVIAQAPFNSPSVFNFYQSDHQPLGSLQDRDLFSPEFQITTDVTSLGLANAIRTLVYEGIADVIGARGYSQGDLDLSYEAGLAADTSVLIDHLDLVLTAGRLSDENRQILFETIDPMPASTLSDREIRVKLALSLISLLPEFNVIY